MQPLEQLRARLQETVRDAFRAQDWGEPQTARQVLLEVRKSFPRTIRRPESLRSLGAAVRDFRATGLLPSYAEVKYVCFACAAPLDGYRVIEDGSRFPPLLERVAELRPLPAQFRRCYQGLLGAYLEYSGVATRHQAGKENWTRLRRYLGDHLDGIVFRGRTPPWAATLSAHANLFTADPCARYRAELRAGNRSSFDALTRGLALTDRSWVVEDVVLSEIDQAIRESDAAFSARVPDLVGLLVGHERIGDPGLSALLARYERCRDTPKQDSLRDLAVGRWGNPWLAQNEMKWRAWVQEPVQRMVTRWLKLDYIEDFFGLLQPAGVPDNERGGYWRQYIDQIEDIYLALGRHAHDSDTEAHRRMRARLAGRLMRFNAAEAGSNALLICIGDYIFIEFAEPGQPCHVFERTEDLADKLGQALAARAGRTTKTASHARHVGRFEHHHSGAVAGGVLPQE